eukprot:4852167-Lingulodinium_polyedra.AAC.1
MARTFNASTVCKMVSAFTVFPRSALANVHPRKKLISSSSSRYFCSSPGPAVPMYPRSQEPFSSWIEKTLRPAPKPQRHS